LTPIFVHNSPVWTRPNSQLSLGTLQVTAEADLRTEISAAVLRCFIVMLN
jgi:hypothetical protein